MPTKKSAISEVYQIKVTLLGTKPPIWRRLHVPASMTLARLHEVLQEAMGWHDCHLHEFQVGGRRIGPPDPDAEPMGMPDVEDESKVRLSRVLREVGAKMRYEYDFGDGWEHEIVLEKRLPADPEVAYPWCSGGEYGCPPEDCGGVHGYDELVRVIANPNHKRHQEMLDWVGEEYDPEIFSVDDVNVRLSVWHRRRGRAPIDQLRPRYA